MASTGMIDLRNPIDIVLGGASHWRLLLGQSNNFGSSEVAPSSNDESVHSILRLLTVTLIEGNRSDFERTLLRALPQEFTFSVVHADLAPYCP